MSRGVWSGIFLAGASFSQEWDPKNGSGWPGGMLARDGISPFGCSRVSQSRSPRMPASPRPALRSTGMEIPLFPPKTSAGNGFSSRTRCVAAVATGCSPLLFTSGQKLLKFTGEGVTLILLNEINGLVSQTLIKLRGLAKPFLFFNSPFSLCAA